jgi:hypothetical protein
LPVPSALGEGHEHADSHEPVDCLLHDGSGAPGGFDCDRLRDDRVSGKEVNDSPGSGVGAEAQYGQLGPPGGLELLDLDQVSNSELGRARGGVAKPLQPLVLVALPEAIRPSI